MPRRTFVGFDSLEFVPISADGYQQKASLTFNNGYGCNVYTHSKYTNTELPYEFELTRYGAPYANSRISDDNVGYCSKEDISELMHLAQQLKCAE